MAMAQCSKSVFMPQSAASPRRLPDASRYWAARAVNGMLLSENSVTPTNAASTICATSSAMESSFSCRFRLRTATTELNSEMSQAQNRSEPSRPAHRPASW